LTTLERNPISLYGDSSISLNTSGGVSLYPGSQQVSLPDIFDPSDIRGRSFFVPSVVMCFGSRGQGKSLFAAVMGEIMLKAYSKNHVRRGHKVMANFHVSYADLVHAYLVDALIDFPEWAHHLYVMIDELDAYFPSGRATTKASLSFVGFMKQIRKRGIELIFTSQYPQEIDRRVLRQIDLFVKPVLINRKRDMKIKVWDWWGKFTGNFAQKAWPPVEDPNDSRYTEPDFEWILFNVNTLFDKYRSLEVVAPFWSESRGDIVMSEWRDEVQVDLARAEAAKDAVETGRESPQIANLEDLLSQQPDGIALAQLLTRAQRLESNIKDSKGLATRAEALGFSIIYNKGYRLYQSDTE